MFSYSHNNFKLPRVKSSTACFHKWSFGGMHPPSHSLLVRLLITVTNAAKEGVPSL